MARKPMVTRTVTSTKVTVLCLDTENAEPINKEFVLARTFKDEKAMLKMIDKLYHDDVVIPTKVVDTQVVVAKVGMSEEEFIKYGHVIA